MLIIRQIDRSQFSWIDRQIYCLHQDLDINRVITGNNMLKKIDRQIHGLVRQIDRYMVQLQIDRYMVQLQIDRYMVQEQIDRYMVQLDRQIDTWFNQTYRQIHGLVRHIDRYMVQLDIYMVQLQIDSSLRLFSLPFLPSKRRKFYLK